MRTPLDRAGIPFVEDEEPPGDQVVARDQRARMKETRYSPGPSLIEFASGGPPPDTKTSEPRQIKLTWKSPIEAERRLRA
jgi:hypothetical protein